MESNLCGGFLGSNCPSDLFRADDSAHGNPTAALDGRISVQGAQGAPGPALATNPEVNPESNIPAASDSAEPKPEEESRSEPFPSTSTVSPGDNNQGVRNNSYGPVRLWMNQKGPDMLWLRPHATQADDLRGILEEVHGTKRNQSRESSVEPPSKCAKVDEADLCMLAESSSQPLEILIANCLKKKMAKELRCSNILLPFRKRSMSQKLLSGPP